MEESVLLPATASGGAGIRENQGGPGRERDSGGAVVATELLVRNATNDGKECKETQVPDRPGGGLNDGLLAEGR